MRFMDSRYLKESRKSMIDFYDRKVAYPSLQSGYASLTFTSLQGCPKDIYFIGPDENKEAFRKWAKAQFSDLEYELNFW